MIKILLYDDNRERRESLEELFTCATGFSFLGAFPDCSHLKSQIYEYSPDIILMDIRMPGVNGIQATQLVKQISPATKIIIQTVYDDDENIFNSLKAGAEGYILKSTPGDKVIQCIEEVYAGGAVITPSIALRVTRYFNTQPLSVSVENGLTSRETEVLQLMTQGLSYKMVAAKLGITYNTVNAHVKKIYEKLSVNSLGEAVSVALRNKIV
jgi:DNA-binding NarL/FixJ family response regulator